MSSSSSRCVRTGAVLLAVLFASCIDGTSSPLGTPKSLSGSVTLNGAPLASVQLTISGTSSSSQQSAVDGSFDFGELGQGVYQLTPTLAGHAFRPASRVVTLTNSDAINLNFAAEAGTVHSISGTVAGSGLMVLTLSGDNTGQVIASAGGTFTIPNLRLGSYFVTPFSPGKTFAPAADTIDGVMDFNHFSSGGVGSTNLVSVTAGGNDRAACFAYFPLNPPEGIGAVRPKRLDEVIGGFEATCIGMWAAQETIVLTYATAGVGNQTMTIQLGPNRTWVLTAPNYELSERMVGGLALAFTATPP